MSESAVVPSASPGVGAAPRQRVVLPSWRDPRLHVAAVLITVQVLGQVALDFELSIAQILASLLTCAALEIAITFHRQRLLVWPASALLTGNGVALILRVEGTAHGDWWSTRGLWIYSTVAGLGLLSKYVIRVDGRPLFNPSNLALVVCFLALGTSRVNPLDFWWGETSAGLVVAYWVIIGGGLAITARIGLASVALTFWVTFAAGLGVVAAAGHCMTARWHVGPLCGAEFWEKLVTSPEILIFALFMITDPRTAPLGRRPRLAYGALVGLLAAALVAPQRTEFAAKIAVLAALVIVCALRAFLERLLRNPPAPAPDGRRRSVAARARRATILTAIAALALLAAGTPARPEVAAALPQIGDGSDVDVPPVPVVARDPSVETITGGVSAEAAQQIGVDVAAQLAAATPDASLELSEMTVLVIRRPIPQSAPRVALLVRGRSALGGVVTPIDTLYTVTEVDGRYLIADELDP